MSLTSRRRSDRRPRTTRHSTFGNYRRVPAILALKCFAPPPSHSVCCEVHLTLLCLITVYATTILPWALLHCACGWCAIGDGDLPSGEFNSAGDGTDTDANTGRTLLHPRYLPAYSCKCHGVLACRLFLTSHRRKYFPPQWRGKSHLFLYRTSPFTDRVSGIDTGMFLPDFDVRTSTIHSHEFILRT